MALKITLVICMTILLLFVIVLLILAAGTKYIEAQKKLNDEEVAKLRAQLEKEKVRQEALREEANGWRREVHALRSKYNDHSLLVEYKA